MLRAENLSMRFFRRTGQANHFFAVKDVSLELRPGEVVLLTGRSGSGKTTLLHMLAGLLTPTGGRVWLEDVDLYGLPDAALSRLRGERIAVIPQGRSAIDTLTVLENVLLPAQLNGQAGDAESALRRLDALGIADLRDARPAELSGGELRRMAIARALSGRAKVILADEPTGDLDDTNTEKALSLLKAAAAEEGRAVLLVTHDREALPYGTRILRMDAGAATEGVGSPSLQSLPLQGKGSSARKTVQWTVFSENGPAGPGGRAKRGRMRSFPRLPKAFPFRGRWHLRSK